MIRALKPRGFERRSAPRVGRRPLDGDARAFLLLLLGHLCIFTLSMAHDEIVAELVENGYVLARLAEQYELFIGLGLFVCWGVLSIRMARLLQSARDTDGSAGE